MIITLIYILLAVIGGILLNVTLAILIIRYAIWLWRILKGGTNYDGVDCSGAGGLPSDRPVAGERGKIGGDDDYNYSIRNDRAGDSHHRLDRSDRSTRR